VICGIVIASTSGPVVAGFSASTTGFSSAFGFAADLAARLAAPIESISILVS
jgi:class 3 adenylate cyclase